MNFFDTFITQCVFTGVLCVLCSVLLIILLKWTRVKKLKLPPGPKGWPFIGNLPVLFQDPGTTNDEYYYTRCARQYGDIYKLKLGSKMMYVLCKFDYVREAFNHSYIQGRPPGVAYQIAFGPEAKGIIFASGSEWKVMKQFAVGVFRELGVGKGVFETRIRAETERLMLKLDSIGGSSICPNLMELFYIAVCNITCGITFGTQFDYEDSRFKAIVNVMQTYSHSIGPSAIFLTSRLLCGLPFGPGKATRGCLSKFKEFLELEIEKHDSKSACSAEKSSSTTFVGAFLGELNKGADENFNKVNLITCCLELFFAGTETTSITLYFTILCLVANPKVRDEAQREVDAFIIDNGMMPCYGDRSKLPYVQSIILEAHRMLILAPLGLAHEAERDLQLFGYDVPKGTLLVPNVGSLFMNPEMFPDPKTFKPERYIKDGHFEAVPDVIPFSTGRRACLGEQLARMEIFLFLTNLLHRYNIDKPEGTEMPNILEGRCGGTRVPFPHAVVISKRNIAT
ncbi:cytochrome P450 2B19-like [Apostichopus japonicus]|uniref:cytochrome P450 2B19-like n=1 Tax=Stichopus japonicus TaxID=307972 RepID=UPI003AB34499